MTITRERRASPRVDAGQILVTLRSGNWYVAANLSTGGIGFAVEEAVRAGDEIIAHVRIAELDEPVDVAATVRYVRRDRDLYHAGASFQGLDALVERPLYRFVEERALLDRAGASSPK